MAETDDIKEVKPDGAPPAVPPSKRIKFAACPKYKIMSRAGVCTDRRRIPLLSNHFKVVLGNLEAVSYQYNVSITTEDGKTLEVFLLEEKRCKRRHTGSDRYNCI